MYIVMYTMMRDSLYDKNSALFCTIFLKGDNEIEEFSYNFKNVK